LLDHQWDVDGADRNAFAAPREFTGAIVAENSLNMRTPRSALQHAGIVVVPATAYASASGRDSGNGSANADGLHSSPPSTPQQPHGRAAAAASPLHIYSPGKVPRLHLPSHVYAHAQHAHDASHDGSAAIATPAALVSPRVFGHGFLPTASSMSGRGGSGGNEGMSPRVKPATPFSWQSFENSCVCALMFPHSGVIVTGLDGMYQCPFRFRYFMFV
jgi:hypothetical protein